MMCRLEATRRAYGRIEGMLAGWISPTNGIRGSSDNATSPTESSHQPSTLTKLKVQAGLLLKTVFSASSADSAELENSMFNI